jgi:hypothetical protein
MTYIGMLIWTLDQVWTLFDAYSDPTMRSRRDADQAVDNVLTVGCTWASRANTMIL